MNSRAFLEGLPPEMRRMPGWQLIAEMFRVDAEFRAVWMEEGSGGFSTDLDIKRIDKILDALRTLPNDAQRDQIAAALAPFRKEPGNSI
jgi:hypothetical protein